MYQLQRFQDKIGKLEVNHYNHVTVENFECTWPEKSMRFKMGSEADLGKTLWRSLVE